MEEEKQGTLKKRFQTLLPPIKHCKICFKEIRIDDFCRLFDQDICICNSCQKDFDPKFIYFSVDGYKAVAFYEYTDYIKKLIYTYKGCFDYELKDTFINLFLKEIKLKYKGYKIVPIPSYKNDDELRGFNHAAELCKLIDLNLLTIIDKTSHFKQAENSAFERRNIKKHLALNSSKSLEKEKVLLVDDIYTTGSTMNAAIKLIETLHPKEIRVLVLAKTKGKETKKSNTKHSLH